MLDDLAKALVGALVVALGELARRYHRSRRERSFEEFGSVRPARRLDDDGDVVPFARVPYEQCPHEPDCVLVASHRGDCYLTAWLFDSQRRRYWRRLRGQPEGK